MQPLTFLEAFCRGEPLEFNLKTNEFQRIQEGVIRSIFARVLGWTTYELRKVQDLVDKPELRERFIECVNKGLVDDDLVKMFPQKALLMLESTHSDTLKPVIDKIHEAQRRYAESHPVFDDYTPGWMKISREFALCSFISNPDSFYFIPIKFRDEKAFLFEAFDRNPAVIGIIENKDFLLELVARDSRHFLNISDAMKTPEFVSQALVRNSEVIKHLQIDRAIEEIIRNQSLIRYIEDRDLLSECSIYYPSTIKFIINKPFLLDRISSLSDPAKSDFFRRISEEVKDRCFCMAALKSGVRSDFLPKAFLNDVDFICEAFEYSPGIIQSILNQDILLDLLSKDAKYFREINSSIKTDEFVFKAIDRNPEVVKFLYNLEQLNQIISRNAEFMKFIEDPWILKLFSAQKSRNKEELLEELSHLKVKREKNIFFSIIADDLKDKDFCLAALERGMEYNNFPEVLKNDRGFCFAALERGVKFYMFPEVLKNDRDFCARVIELGLFEDAVIYMRNKDIHLHLLELYPALDKKYFSEIPDVIKNDRDFCIRAVELNPNFINHIRNENTVLYILKSKPDLYGKISFLLKMDNDFAQRAAYLNPLVINFVELPTFKYLIERIPDLVKSIHNYDLRALAIIYNPDSHRYFEEEILLEIIVRHPIVLRFIKDGILAPSFLEKAINRNPDVLDHFENEAIKLKALSDKPDLLKTHPSAFSNKLLNNYFESQDLPFDVKKDESGNVLRNADGSPVKGALTKNFVMSLKNESLRRFLILKILENLDSDHLCGSTIDLTPALANIVFASWKIAMPDFGHKKEFKNAIIRQSLLLFLNDLDDQIKAGIVSTDEALILFSNCYNPKIGLDESAKRAQFLILALKMNKKTDVMTLITKGNFNPGKIRDCLINPLIEDKLLDPKNEDGFIKILSNSRATSAIMNYISRIHSEDYDISVKEAFIRFLNSISEGSFIPRRHLANSYKSLIRDCREAWETGQTKEIEIRGKRQIIKDSEDWQDLFMQGTEVQGSCQRIDGDKRINKCLLGYVLNGKTRVLCIKDNEEGPIKARAIIKIMKRDGFPVLLLKPIYSSSADSDQKDAEKTALIAFAKERAEAIGLDLYMSDEGGGGDTELISDVDNVVAPFEYEDYNLINHHEVVIGITSGKSRVRARKIFPE
jgi:hypothetical protein